MARPASDIAERIVRAARDRFLIEGVDGASLRAIARDAGTNLGMVYYYYPNKDDLFLAVVEPVYAELLDQFAKLVAAAPDIATKVEVLYARLGALSDDEMTVLRLLIREAISSPSSRMQALFERFSRGHVAMLATMFQGGIARGEVRTDLPPLPLVMASVCLGLLPQLVRRRLAEAQVPVDVLFPSPPDLAHMLTKVLLSGLAQSSPASGDGAAAAAVGAEKSANKPEPSPSKARAVAPKTPESKPKRPKPSSSRK